MSSIASHRRQFSGFLLIVEVILMLLFFFFVRYEDNPKNHGKYYPENATDYESMSFYYPLFQDVNIMIFIGFGFLMTFLSKYGLSALSLNYLIAAFVIQLAVLCVNFKQIFNHGYVAFQPVTLLDADFACGAVLISFGAVLGKTSPIELVIMSIIEVIFYSFNSDFLYNNIKAADIGGSMAIHTFGAYFGLTVTRVIYQAKHTGDEKEASNSLSDKFSMIGTIFLWCFWPSFNGATGIGSARDRAIINTFLSLAGCVVSAMLASQFFRKGSFSMTHIQNATLAGGVAMGSIADMIVTPGGAVAVGFLAGILSVFGYQFLQAKLESKFGIHDTCGVNNLHGMPGIFSAILSIFITLFSSKEGYSTSLANVFSEVANGNRTFVDQALFQLLALLFTIFMAVVGGLITGIILRFGPFDFLTSDDLFTDEKFFGDEEEQPINC